MSIYRQKNNPLYAINYEHAPSSVKASQLVDFEESVQGRWEDCCGLTGKWYTVKGELLPAGSCPVCWARCSNTRQEDDLHCVFLFKKFDSFNHIFENNQEVGNIF